MGDTAMAVVRIQSAVRAYQARKKDKMIQDLPNLKDPEVKAATVKIQSSFRGFQARKKVREYKSFDIVMAVIRIQSAYRAYRARKKVEMLKEMPNLRDPEVKQAAVKIQSVYRGFQSRKVAKKPSAMDVAMSVIRIQRAYRRYKARKLNKSTIRLQQENIVRATSKAKGANYKVPKPSRGTQPFGHIKVDERDVGRRQKKTS